MNIIPTIFNENIPSYTAVGGKERIASTGISAVILNPPGHPRRTFFQELEKTGFDNIISIESCAPHYDIEELSGRFPFVRFILPEKKLNLGEQINLAACEIEAPLFFVLRSDMKMIAGGTARRMAERLSVNKRLCTVPLIMNSNYEALPSLVAPMAHKKKMRTFFLEGQNEGDLSLYPFDGIGIYDRQRFIGMGGFDVTLNRTHWQLMDFGFRSYLWGEEIAVNLHFKFAYDNDPLPEDYSAGESYKRFYLKNIAPVYRRDYAHLPFYRFPGFLFKSGEDIISAMEEFKQARKWITVNKYRFKSDAHEVLNKWNERETQSLKDTDKKGEKN